MGILVLCLVASVAIMGGVRSTSDPRVNNLPTEFTNAVHACLKGFNNKVINDVSSYSECLELCGFEGRFPCRSFEYLTDHKLCTLSSENSYTQPRNYNQPCHTPGWIYSERENQFCAAEGATCAGQSNLGSCRSQCHFGNGEYVSPVQNCGSGCTCCIPSRSSTEWTRELGACIRGNNDLKLSEVSLDDCKARCESNPGFPCRSVEYNYFTRSCALSKADSSSRGYRSPCFSNFLGMTFTEIRNGAPPPLAADFAPAPVAADAPADAPAPGDSALAAGNDEFP